LASLETDVFAQRYALEVVHATIGLDWIGRADLEFQIWLQPGLDIIDLYMM